MIIKYLKHEKEARISLSGNKPALVNAIAGVLWDTAKSYLYSLYFIHIILPFSFDLLVANLHQSV